jgi:hypothetical protein
MPHEVHLTLRKAILIAWSRLRDRVEITKDLSFNHEFTLQFHLAWEVAQVLGFPNNLGVLFEVPCDCDDNGERIRLDLLMWTNPKAKVAIELKAPVRSETGSNTTQSRMRFYRDIHRLRHLVDSRYLDIVSGYFLAVVNERSYVVAGVKQRNVAYKTYHGTVVPRSHRIPPDHGPNGCKFLLKMPSHQIKFDWLCHGSGVNISKAPGMQYFWLKPIAISAA